MLFYDAPQSSPHPTSTTTNTNPQEQIVNVNSLRNWVSQCLIRLALWLTGQEHDNNPQKLWTAKKIDDALEKIEPPFFPPYKVWIAWKDSDGPHLVTPEHAIECERERIKESNKRNLIKSGGNDDWYLAQFMARHQAWEELRPEDNSIFQDMG